MAQNRDLKFIAGGEKLTFNHAGRGGGGWAINPQGKNAICFAGDYRNQLITIVGTGNVLIYASAQRLPPDFTLPSTIDNSYTTVMSADYQAVGTYYTGAAGVAVSSSTKIVEINTNLLTWIGIHRSAEGVDVKITEGDNS